MGLNIKHGLIDTKLMDCWHAGILGPVSYLDFVCDRLCFFVYTVVE